MFQSCKSANASCFGGGFIDDLSALNRIIISASNETAAAYVDLDGDGISEFSEGFFEALYGYNMSVDKRGVTVDFNNPVNADTDGDLDVSLKEAFNYAYEHDDARWVVGHQIGYNGCPIDESPWFDDDDDGLPTFKASCDIFLLGDFNFDGKVDVTDYDMFMEVWTGEYRPLYDLNDNGIIDCSDLCILTQCLEIRYLTISTSSGGTTTPTPGTYEHILNKQVNVTASAYASYIFDYWLLDGAVVYDNPITVTMDSNHTLEAYFRLPTLTVKTRKTTGSEIFSVKVWIDNVEYNSPVNIALDAGTHVVQVESYFFRNEWWLYTFDHWEDGSTANPRTVSVDDDMTITAYYTEDYLCPTLFVWNGFQYVYEALLNIHAESDVPLQHQIQQTLVPNGLFYKLQLRELDNFTSHIDQVKLYAVDADGEWHICPLTIAKQNGTYVTLKLLFDDEWRTDLKLSEIINLKFLPSIPYTETAYFIFEINGHNRKINP